jgi:hypothetical protein
MDRRQAATGTAGVFSAAVAAPPLSLLERLAHVSAFVECGIGSRSRGYRWRVCGSWTSC